MKEKLLKIAKLNEESANLVADEKFDDAITKMQEAQKLTKEVADEVKDEPTSEEKEDVEKTAKENISKIVKEEIKKWASVNVSNDTLTKVFEDLVEASWLVKNVESVTKTVETLQESVKKLEDTEDEPASKDPEKVDKTKKGHDVWDSM